VRRHFIGPLTGLGVLVAALVCLLDQAHKLWMLFSFDIAAHEPVEIAPFFEVILVWNRGVSYGLFEQDTALGQWGLVLFKIVAVIVLLAWLARTTTRLGAVALGLIIGGAIGNAIDRAAYGAVADFFHFHIGHFSWYVFNIADIGIVAGVAMLLYEAVLGKGRPSDAETV
jgi:signal peptidase II